MQVEPSRYRPYDSLVPEQASVGRILLEPMPDDAWRAAWRTLAAPFGDGPVLNNDVVELRSDDEAALLLAYRLIEKTNEAVGQ